MATITFLWHLHQPAYRTADGVAHAPWVALHAGGSYTTLARALADGGARGHVVNIVPTLLEQLLAYRDGRAADPVLHALTSPAAELTEDARQTLVEWGFQVGAEQLARLPRLRELAERRGDAPDAADVLGRYGVGDLRDLQVLFILAYAGEQAWRDERLAPLWSKGSAFTAHDHGEAAAWLEAQPGELVALWRRLARLDGVEIATSPYAHPIMPLLVDTEVVRESWAPDEAPKVPAFRHPDDARRQLELGLAYMSRNGFATTGCWPPEGSVSAAALDVYAACGVRWLCTDEGILARSLDMDLRAGSGHSAELYRPWRLAPDGPTIFFRDRWLSDRIGFVYGHWDDERRAAGDLVEHLDGLAAELGPDAAIVVALDGENPWPHYPECGGTFLRELVARLGEPRPHLHPATFAELLDRVEPADLPRLHPGSWINSVFATWIGHPEKTAAWTLLASVRELVSGFSGTLPQSMVLAEGSDWFWWLGDDNPTHLAPLYDRIFRHHLEDACASAGVEPPADLDRPLKTVTRTVRVPVSRRWQAPVLDGRVTTYFEWSLASSVEASDDDNPLRRVALWGSDETLYVLVEGREAMQNLVNGDRLVVELDAPGEGRSSVTVSRDGCSGSGFECAIGRVAEVAMPWSAGTGLRLEVRLGSSQLPEGGSLLLEPFLVDEELTPEP